ncbi:MAG: N(4)-(beta-N-acetylglucosaminyl)-L-asparaginase [Candidatus Eremiobacteraeota bacterium]|nr:N(4)-(beta-N-acetylglucosaminyl)-L-asparaginase [Candidatus Eremiobacteraeota bacterium]
MDPIDRRRFIASAAGTAALSALDLAQTAEPAQAAASAGPILLATWPHGKPANEKAAEVMAAGGSLLDAVEKGINVVEDDPKIQSVGYGGLPNADGEVELDAGIMSGTTHRIGAVVNLHQIKNPISVARKVMEKTRHSTMAGEGALRFALAEGFTPMQLLTPQSLQAWLDWKNDPHHVTYWLDAEHHDTIGMIANDGRGHLVAGCSTSGIAWKIPGRVADSPLVGSGYYADDHAGAASATGDGDAMQCYVTSFQIVMLMAQGRTPQQACEECLRYMATTSPATRTIQACVIAMNPRGDVGAASMNAKYPLQYALWRNGKSEILDAKPVL